MNARRVVDGVNGDWDRVGVSIVTAVGRAALINSCDGQCVEAVEVRVGEIGQSLQGGVEVCNCPAHPNRRIVDSVAEREREAGRARHRELAVRNAEANFDECCSRGIEIADADPVLSLVDEDERTVFVCRLRTGHRVDGSVVDRIDGQCDRRGSRVERAVERSISEAIGAVEVRIRCVSKSAIRIDDNTAVPRLCDDFGGQLIAFNVGIVDEQAVGQEQCEWDVFECSEGIVGCDRCVVDRVDGQREGVARLCAVQVSDSDGDRRRAGLIGGRSDLHRAVRSGAVDDDVGCRHELSVRRRDADREIVRNVFDISNEEAERGRHLIFVDRLIGDVADGRCVVDRIDG